MPSSLHAARCAALASVLLATALPGLAGSPGPTGALPMGAMLFRAGDAPPLLAVPFDLAELGGPGVAAAARAAAPHAQPAVLFPIAPWQGTAQLPVPVSGYGALLGFPGLVLNPGKRNVTVELRVPDLGLAYREVVTPGHGAWLMAFARGGSGGIREATVETWALDGNFLGGLGLRGSMRIVATETADALGWPAGPPPTGDKLAPHLAVIVRNLQGSDWTFVAGSQAVVSGVMVPPLPGPGEALAVCNGWGAAAQGSVAPEPGRVPCQPAAAFVEGEDVVFSLVPPLTEWYLFAVPAALPEALAHPTRIAVAPGGVVLDAVPVMQADLTLR
ncbi:MAG: hypothetical protein LC624_00635 [Halobacteriales archaeon]|nr:hypothetical protein [Halobacteriales archaeon]